MKARLKFYCPLGAINFLSLMLLFLFFSYNWYLSDHKTLYEASVVAVSQNPRWITWGIFASIPGLIIGVMATLGAIFLPLNDEFFKELSEGFIMKVFLKGSAFLIYISFIPLLVICSFLWGMLIKEDWRLSLLSAFEVTSIGIALPIFLITALVLLPILLIDVLKKIINITA